MNSGSFSQMLCGPQKYNRFETFMGGFQCSGNISFCIYFVTCQHSLCTDMEYIKSLQYVSAFQPSSDNLFFTLASIYM
jgi:hypothetical protein